MNSKNKQYVDHKSIFMGITCLGTVGIVAYNTDISILEKCLKSLKDSSIPLTIIILCNSPSPEYQESVAQLVDHQPIKLISWARNRGFGAAHNQILRLVSSPWYICCNPDVFVKPDTIEKLISSGELLTQSVILGPRILNEDQIDAPLGRKHLTLRTWLHRQLWRVNPYIFKPHEILFNYEKTQETQFISGSFFAIRTEHMRALRGFDERFFLYCEDADLSRRASDLGKNYYISHTSVTHIWSKDWKRSMRALFLQIQSLMTYFQIHGFFR
jgi:GT2 family glycosyltransferase